jgi:hypothetical protein
VVPDALLPAMTGKKGKEGGRKGGREGGKGEYVVVRV